MRKVFTGCVAMMVSLGILTLSGASPALAISVELAKKCRDMAIQAHPPAAPGTTGYAQAERDFFRECVAKNGEMTNNSAAKPTPAAPKLGLGSLPEV